MKMLDYSYPLYIVGQTIPLEEMFPTAKCNNRDHVETGERTRGRETNLAGSWSDTRLR